jgi:hypothetical protein
VLLFDRDLQMRAGFHETGSRYTLLPFIKLRVITDIEGPLSKFSVFAYNRGSLYRHKSAVWHKFDMVWLYLSPIAVERRVVFYSFKRFLPAFAVLRGGGVSTLCHQV